MIRKAYEYLKDRYKGQKYRGHGGNQIKVIFMWNFLKQQMNKTREAHKLHKLEHSKIDLSFILDKLNDINESIFYMDNNIEIIEQNSWENIYKINDIVILIHRSSCEYQPIGKIKIDNLTILIDYKKSCLNWLDTIYMDIKCADGRKKTYYRAYVPERDAYLFNVKYTGIPVCRESKEIMNKCIFLMKRINEMFNRKEAQENTRKHLKSSLDKHKIRKQVEDLFKNN